MKKIYKPITNIAHELRTPLTNIYGYAQYLMNAKISDEDRIFANQYILDESRNMKEIIDHLLIMGGINKNNIKYDNVDFDQLISNVMKKYPEIKVESKAKYIKGDKVLLECLLENLISNAYKASATEVRVVANQSGISIWNNGDVIDKKKLKELNKGQKSIDFKKQGHGFGVSLCHEIVKKHRGKLLLSSSIEEGTRVEIIITLYF